MDGTAFEQDLGEATGRGADVEAAETLDSDRKMIEAVNELQGNYQVVVVDQDNKAHMRPAKTGERIGAMWEMTDGLKSGERVVVQGLQKTREGAQVAVKDWTPPADALVSRSDQSKGH